MSKRKKRTIFGGGRDNLIIRVDRDLVKWFGEQAAKREVTRNRLMSSWLRALMRSVQAVESCDEVLEADELRQGLGDDLVRRVLRLVDLTDLIQNKVVPSEERDQLLLASEDLS